MTTLFITSNLVRHAFALATELHRGQVRRYTGAPYIDHPVNVADLVEEAGLAEEVVAAALLHDVVEDCGATFEFIRQECGEPVAQLVAEVTDVSRPEDGNRAYRKLLDRLHLAKASPEGKSIKLADIADNTESIIKHDPDFAKIYLGEARELLPDLRGGDPSLYMLAWRLVRRS